MLLLWCQNPLPVLQILLGKILGQPVFYIQGDTSFQINFLTCPKETTALPVPLVPDIWIKAGGGSPLKRPHVLIFSWPGGSVTEKTGKSSRRASSRRAAEGRRWGFLYCWEILPPCLLGVYRLCAYGIWPCFPDSWTGQRPLVFKGQQIPSTWHWCGLKVLSTGKDVRMEIPAGPPSWGMLSLPLIPPSSPPSSSSLSYSLLSSTQAFECLLYPGTIQKDVRDHFI